MKRENTYLREGEEWVVRSSRDGGDRVVVEVDQESASFQVACVGDGDFVLTDETGVDHRISVSAYGDHRWVTVNGKTHCLERLGRRQSGRSGHRVRGALTSPMPGKVIEVRVVEGDTVSLGDTLMVVEAMKMEHAIVANEEGTVFAIHFAEGDRVQAGATLVSLEADGEEG